MQTVFVQFSDEEQVAVIAVFSSAQDEASYPNQGQIADSDSRYMAFVNAPLWSAYQAVARSALNDSDNTIMRCYENSVVVPTAWVAYRKALRAIISAETGDPAQPLPTKPAYPPGT